MSTTIIIALVIGVLFCVGGPIIGHYASIAGEKAEKKEESNKAKDNK